MRHKLCRSFHPWCPGVKTRCLCCKCGEYWWVLWASYYYYYYYYCYCYYYYYYCYYYYHYYYYHHSVNNIPYQCDINCAGHFTLDALASRHVACVVNVVNTGECSGLVGQGESHVMLEVDTGQNVRSSAQKWLYSVQECRKHIACLPGVYKPHPTFQHCTANLSRDFRH